MNILIIDPFYEYSHRVWAEGLQKYSTHHVDILSLSPHHWKWRMTGGAVELAEKYKALDSVFNLILASDMLDLSAFLALAKVDRSRVATAIYFHENQITYPWNTKDSSAQKEKNHHYGFINFTSCLTADKVYFNSKFHEQEFLNSLPSFLKIFPSFGHQKYVDTISAKSEVLPLGMDLRLNKPLKEQSNLPCFLWNHRWEHDKNPELFFQTLYKLKADITPFELIVMGKSYERQPAIFEEAREHLQDEILHFGYVESAEEYIDLVDRANILLVTSNQDFFGISIVEAIASGLYPLLPNRLAYPDHIPDELHQKHLYQNDDDVLPMLKELILARGFVEASSLPTFVRKYDWGNLIELYDSTFSNLENRSF